MYNPRKCNSASKLSCCIQREQSKIKFIKVFEKTLMGGLSCVNTRQSFDMELLMPNLTEAGYRKMNISESFKVYKRDDLKVIYKIKLDDDDSFYDRRIITKILKVDENNQYGFAMTKPMPTGCIKEHPAPTWPKFNFLIETVDLDDTIGHLLIADIEFNVKDATKLEYICNAILPPIIEKQKILEANKRSFYQLFDLFSKKPKSYRCTAKPHATLFPTKFIPFYLENLNFLITRCFWKVSKIYLH